jgi:ribonuclease HI
VDAESRYTPIEKVCMSLYFACNELHHYLLSSSCIVVCCYDIVKHMLHKPILKGRLGKWAYTLVEYDLSYEPLRAMKGQVVADFIADHVVMSDDETFLVELKPWSMFFDGSVCGKGQGVGCVLVSPNRESFKIAIRLEHACTNNQAEYEALLYRLKYLVEMGVKNIDAYDDSMLVVQHVRGESQCLDGILNSYGDKCSNIIRTLDHFHVSHIGIDENKRANDLAQEALGYDVVTGVFIVKEMHVVLVMCPRGNHNNLD